MTVENNQQQAEPHEAVLKQTEPIKPQVLAEPIKTQGLVGASGRPVIRAAAPALSSQSAAVEEKISRPQITVTPQPPLDAPETPPAPVQQMQQEEKKEWWSVINKTMLILGILVSAGVVVSLWALGIILKADGFEEFIKRNFWWLVFPIFAGVMALLISLEKGKEKRQALEYHKRPEKKLEPEQVMRESEEDYKARMQEVHHYQDRAESDGQVVKIIQSPPPQPAPRKEAVSGGQEQKPTPEMMPAPEPQAPLPPPPPIEFTHQSANALPIAHDGGSFFPQNAIKLKSSKPPRDDD